MSSLSSVFLDRDGTLNVKAPEGAYVTGRAQLELLPRAGGAVSRLNRAGVPVFVVTNQRGVALGLMSLADVQGVNAALQEMLGSFGAHIDAFYVCPHAEGSCGCRKPLPGLLLQAAAEHPGISLERSVVIGDSEADVEAAISAGSHPVRLGPPGAKTLAREVFPDLDAAVRGVLGESPDRSSEAPA